jgi:FolB domain-containing protein
MSAWVHIYDLKVAAKIGIYGWEQAIDQTLLISVDAELRPKDSARSLDESLDYEKLSQAIKHLLHEHAFELIETVAEAIMDLILIHPVVHAAKVLVKKPHAVPQSAGVGFSLYRARILAAEVA